VVTRTSGVITRNRGRPATEPEWIRVACAEIGMVLVLCKPLLSA